MSAPWEGTPARHLPAPGRPVPVSTYRLQLGPALTFADARAQVPYLASLGVTHLYLSPVLAAAPGSQHGYDVVDHGTVSEVLGGRDGLRALADAAHAAGLGLVLDIVPNHMAVPTPAWLNRALWSVLAEGSSSPYAPWFDVDWSAGEGALLMPVLGERIGAVLARGELTLDEVDVPGEGPTRVLRYYDHAFPVREGTEHLPLPDLVERQHYRLAYWRVADEELNYRRFFDIDTLAAVRVEDPDVFDATHALVLELLADGTVDGLRVDHPDGLADPAGYLERLRERTGGAWVVVEKILEGEEELDPEWDTAGTTGYDGLWRVQQTFVDPGGAAELGALMHRIAGDTSDALAAVIEEAKREVVAGPLYAEVHRITDLAAEICHDDLWLRDHTWRALHDCLIELLVAFDRYRAYVVPGRPVDPASLAAMEAAAHLARERLAPERLPTLDVVVELLLGHAVGEAGRTGEAQRDELVVRFQQTCGAVMAKGVEDTAFYRWTQLVSLCEVGGEPSRFALPPTELVSWAAHAQRATPLGMTTSSTHDTKRTEDTRTRIGVLSELPLEWAALVEQLRAASAPYRSALLDGRTENLLWQTLAGTWTDQGPLAADRLTTYLTKAVREAKTHTSWVSPDADYEEGVLLTARSALVDPQVQMLLTGWEERTREAVRAATLGTKLVQLTLPGVADVYQGTEAPVIALVDPDNRRPVPVDELAARLARLDTGAAPRDLADEKLLVTARTLRTRRDAPEAFTGPHAGFVPLAHSSDHAVTFARTVEGTPHVVVVATRLAVALERLGGWGEHTVALPDGHWRDVLRGGETDGGLQRIGPLLTDLPVALLVRAEE
ncbi:malto-oligosyltrehalose synthase [Cellulomonas sp. P22]|uniref:malto-oligosyltrehalose synthase n=1 Tax=Cellulomonas sp. P22 TaxID=3373189 RepID=UPI00378F4188